MIPFYLLTDDRQKLQGVQVQHAARIRDGHRESARSGDADDGEGAEVDSDEPVSRVQITGIQSIWDIMYGETASWERGCRYGIQTQDQPRWVPYSHGRDTRRDTDGIA